jgi:hypothetical protein
MQSCMSVLKRMQKQRGRPMSSHTGRPYYQPTTGFAPNRLRRWRRRNRRPKRSGQGRVTLGVLINGRRQ